MASEPERFLNGKVELHCGDMLAVLPTLPECSVDSCVTDPPYNLTSIVKRFKDTQEDDDTITSQRVRERSDGYARLVAGGFMGCAWDGTGIAFRVETWREIYRVLKPGAHLLAFGGTRTFHRMACGIEDAGFEIRDTIMWVYGSGFPKSHDISKAIDRTLGAKGTYGDFKTAEHDRVWNNVGNEGWQRPWRNDPDANDRYARCYISGTEEAARYEGFGTALKPAVEPIIVARKPLAEATVAANVLKWETGAMNVDGCRIATNGENVSAGLSDPQNREGVVGTDLGFTQASKEKFQAAQIASLERTNRLGRWPANLIHDGSDEVLAAFPAVGDSHPPCNEGSIRENHIFGKDERPRDYHAGFKDNGSAARFFYTAKADSDDRLGSKHPTVKPLDLMQYLVRLVTPKGGVCLDCFAGTGTTGEAAFREGMHAVLIEREDAYCADIRRRMTLAMAGSDERARESVKARNLPRDDGPLFQFQMTEPSTKER